MTEKYECWTLVHAVNQRWALRRRGKVVSLRRRRLGPWVLTVEDDERKEGKDDD